MRIRRFLALARQTPPALGASLGALMGSGGTLSQQMARGGIWVFTSYALQQILSLIRSIILARLLLPADFGVMGLAALSTAALALLSQTGVGAALIQRKGLDKDLLNTAWTISGIRGIILGLVAVALAPVGASFFEEPLLAPILRVMALTFVLSGVNSLGLILLRRDLDFRRLTLFGLVVGTVNLCVAATAAFLWRNVWALVVGELAAAVVALPLSYAMHEFRPGFGLVRNSARQLLDFGKHVNAVGILTYLTTQGDDAYVGKVLGTESLGFYRLAYRLSNLPATSITQVLSLVTLPAFSAIQDDLPRLRKLVLFTLRLTALVSIPLAGGLFALAPLLVGVLYGEKWLPMVPAFMVLCIFGLERSLGSILGSMLMAMGRPNLVFRVNALKFAAMVLGIVPLTARYGFLGTSIAVTLSAIVVQFAIVPVAARLLEIPSSEILGQLLKPLVGTLLMVGAILVLREVLSWQSGLGPLVGLGLIGFLVYAASVLPTERELLQRVLASIRPATRAEGQPT